MDHKEQLLEIQRLIQRRTYFIGISGWSGISAGCLALMGTAYGFYLRSAFRSGVITDSAHILKELLWVASVILILSLSISVLLSYRAAKVEGRSLWTHASKSLVLNSGFVLLVGGLFALLMIYKGYPFNLLSPAVTLIFYGLSCMIASYHTFSSVKFLGVAFILLGLINLFLPQYSLELWAIGFGGLHIIYGFLHLKQKLR